MTPHKRLWLVAALIIFSATYAVIVTRDKSLAYASALGYIAVLLTILVYLHICGRSNKDG